MIADLMEEFDAHAFEEPQLGQAGIWIPSSPRGKRIFGELCAEAHRAALKNWYAQLHGIELNERAAALQRSLERAIGEKLT